MLVRALPALSNIGNPGSRTQTEALQDIPLHTCGAHPLHSAVASLLGCPLSGGGRVHDLFPAGRQAGSRRGGAAKGSAGYRQQQAVKRSEQQAAAVNCEGDAIVKLGHLTALTICAGWMSPGSAEYSCTLPVCGSCSALTKRCSPSAEAAAARRRGEPGREPELAGSTCCLRRSGRGGAAAYLYSLPRPLGGQLLYRRSSKASSIKQRAAAGSRRQQQGQQQEQHKTAASQPASERQ
jgi:hypothetical protein